MISDDILPLVRSQMVYKKKRQINFIKEILMKIIRKTFMAILLPITMLLVGVGSISPVSAQVENQQYSNPSWAPLYVLGVRYYYFPDIETYYDLSNQDFVYLDKGEWQFSSTLPPIHSGFDLYNGFTIALKAGVTDPWLNNQHYLSLYPRHYYRNEYKIQELEKMRGFDENRNIPFLRDIEERN
jgi:hypothetical protein